MRSLKRRTLRHSFTGLEPYWITLYEEAGDKFLIVFECMAESEDHAEEQALNAYPEGRINMVTKP